MRLVPLHSGAVVIDAAFRTNDPDIYATGSLAKFSRKLGKGRLPLKYHNAREVGFKLADSLIVRARWGLFQLCDRSVCVNRSVCKPFCV